MSRQNVRVANKNSEMYPNAGVSEQELTVSTSVVSFDAFNELTTHVLITVNDEGVRVKFDGTDPTTSSGHALAAGTQKIWDRTLAGAAKFIRDGDSDATIYLTELVC